MQQVLGPIRRIRFTQYMLRQASIREKEGPSLGKIQVKNPHHRSPHCEIWGQISGRDWKTTAMCPKQGLEPCQKHLQAHTKKTRVHSTRPRKIETSWLRKHKSRRKESLWWILHTTKSAVKNHISSEMARELIAIYQTMCHPLSLVYQRVPHQHPHLLLHHLHHRILYLMSTDTPKIQYKNEVEVRVRSYGEIRCINQQKPKTKNKNEGREEVQCRICCMRLPDWSHERSERIWWATGQTLRLSINILPDLLMNYQWSREPKWNRVG